MHPSRVALDDRLSSLNNLSNWSVKKQKMFLEEKLLVSKIIQISRNKGYSHGILLGVCRCSAIDSALGKDFAVEGRRHCASMQDVSVDCLVMAHADVVIVDSITGEVATHK